VINLKFELEEYHRCIKNEELIADLQRAASDWINRQLVVSSITRKANLALQHVFEDLVVGLMH